MAERVRRSSSFSSVIGVRLFQTVGFDGGFCPEALLLGDGEVGSGFGDDVDPVLVSDGEKADGPIGAKHDTTGSEGLNHGIDVGLELFLGPTIVIGLGGEAGKFAIHVGAFGEFLHVLAPGRHGFMFDAGLGEVIDDECLIGVFVDELDGVWEMALEDEDVVSQMISGKLTDAAVEICAEDVIFVGLILQDVADSAEFGIGGEFFKNSADVRIGERDPTDDAFDESVLAGQFEQPASFFHGLAGLHGDRSTNAIGEHFFVQAGWQEVTAEHLHVIVDPGVFFGIEMPEMVMGVDFKHLDSRGGPRARWCC